MDLNPEKPHLLELFLLFARVSAVTIGGGYVMYPMLEQELVTQKKWISHNQLIDYYALAQSIPGVIAINTATLVGYQKRGVSGAMVSVLGMVLPSLITILTIAIFLVPYLDQVWVQKAFAGIRAAVVALMTMAVWKISKNVATTPLKIGIAVTSFLVIIGLHGSPILVILGGALLGFFLFGKGGKK